jgi:hypothetical protein
LPRASPLLLQLILLLIDFGLDFSYSLFLLFHEDPAAFPLDIIEDMEAGRPYDDFSDNFDEWINFGDDSPSTEDGIEHSEEQEVAESGIGEQSVTEEVNPILLRIIATILTHCSLPMFQLQ